MSDGSSGRECLRGGGPRGSHRPAVIAASCLSLPHICPRARGAVTPREAPPESLGAPVTASGPRAAAVTLCPPWHVCPPNQRAVLPAAAPAEARRGDRPPLEFKPQSLPVRRHLRPRGLGAPPFWGPIDRGAAAEGVPAKPRCPSSSRVRRDENWPQGRGSAATAPAGRAP